MPTSENMAAISSEASREGAKSSSERANASAFSKMRVQQKTSSNTTAKLQTSAFNPL
eukprot:CAMPEP_0115577924 /NCGR_PEP_ID=MMETSP0272-20121206/3323_1 /TAXON_ID=71861 /ORGANISM="Scrippsiella trochoidea, Strain CCMP3099" /LENGTH=56 /DNA_ID=CAMNT_0003012751 /DNA_START=235 /DNA_END=405 /DNA_ORIENTATION=-